MSVLPKKPTVLMPNMGEGEMPDTPYVQDFLKASGAEVISADLSYNGTIRHLPWDEIDVVDLRNMRGSLTNYERYIGLVNRIGDKIEAEAQRGHTITMIPGFEEIEWIASKASYLTHLSDQGIETIPTQVIKRHSSSVRPSIVHPDNIDASITAILEHIHAGEKTTYVLKPSVSSLAKGLYFINKCDEDGYTVEYPQEGKASDIYRYETDVQLSSFLRQYLISANSPDEAFLLQDYVENLETSAVFVDGTPHYIERTHGVSRIAHGKYGGTDTLIEPDPRLTAFVKKVRDVLPEHVRQSPFLRIDCMWDIEHEKYILSEIEGAGAARLWLKEAGRVQDYSQMLIMSSSHNGFFITDKKLPQPHAQLL